MIDTHSIIGRFGLPCVPAGGRFRFSVSKSKENKATGIIANVHTEKSIFPSFGEAI